MTGDGAQTAQIRMEQYNDSADAPDIRTRRYRGSSGSPSAIQSGDYLYRSNHEFWNGSALIVGGTFAFDNTNDANRTQFAVSVTTDGTSADANTPSKTQFKIDGNDSGAITFNNSYKFPTSDGTNGQALITNGSGVLSFGDAGGGSGAGFPFSGSAVITGSLYVSGSTISGSFVGDGSGLTGVTINQFATFEDTFTNAPSHSAVHNFGTKNVFVQVFEDDDTLLIPYSVTTTTANQVDIVFGDTLSGRVVIGRAGHILQDTGNFVSSSTAVQTFTNAITASINHNLDSFNVITQVFDSNNNVIVPSNIKVATKDRVDLTFASSRSGKVVIAKAGHIVSGSTINATTASYVLGSNVDGTVANATTASYVLGSNVDGTVANATTASFALTASYAENAGGGNVTGSFTNVTSSIVTHNFGTKAVIVQVYDTNDYVINPSSIRANTVNQVTVTFSTPESGIIVVGS